MAARNGKAALVTGAATGIGRAAAIALAKAGYDVAVNYSRNADGAAAVVQACTAEGVKAVGIRADVADDPAVRAMADEVKRTFGRLDVLINNAGITMETPPRDLDGIDVEQWRRVFDVNVLGIVLVSRAVAPMLRAATGCIVNTCSIAGLRPAAQPLAYAASKASVANLTRTLAAALGPEIRVNAVAPGWIAGDWMERTLGDNYDRLMERRAKQTPLRRNVTFEDVADSMMALVEHNKCVAGEIVIVDGGFANIT
ncbi:MAG: SDR family NAD(P)-dependent oxidoreductase [Rhodospirillales bacterium]